MIISLKSQTWNSAQISVSLENAAINTKKEYIKGSLQYFFSSQKLFIKFPIQFIFPF